MSRKKKMGSRMVLRVYFGYLRSKGVGITERGGGVGKEEVSLGMSCEKISRILFLPFKFIFIY